MELKDLIGLLFLAVAIPAVVAVVYHSERARDAAFVVMVFSCVISDRLGINFISDYWYYRGSTRGFEFCLSDVLALGILAASILAPKEGESRWYWPAGLGFMILYFLYCCFSVTISDPKLFGLFELSKIARGIVIFVATALYVRGERQLKFLVWALVGTVAVEGLMAVKHRFILGLDRVPGTLSHPNSLSMYLCAVTPVLMAAASSSFGKGLRIWAGLCVGAATVTVLLTLSRAGIPIFGLVVLGTAVWGISLRITLRKLMGFLAVSAVAAVLLFRSWDTLKDRFEGSDLKEEYSKSNFESRGFYLWITHEIAAERFWGLGLNNWSWWVSSVYGPRLGVPYIGYPAESEAPSKDSPYDLGFAPPAHCLAALTLGELGQVGAWIFAILWLRWLQMGASFLWRRSPDPEHRLGVGIFFGTCGVFLQSITEWVYRQTSIFLTVHILLGVLASLYYLKRNARRMERTCVDTGGEEAELVAEGESLEAVH